MVKSNFVVFWLIMVLLLVLNIGLVMFILFKFIMFGDNIIFIMLLLLLMVIIRVLLLYCC